MENFARYARYYDLLYADKDYAAEVHYVSGLIRSLDARAVSLLELGCGTGIHAALLAGQGFRVHGVDRSDVMLEEASRRVKDGNPVFALGDAREIRLKTTFDVALSLFHVISYQTTNDDLLRFFDTANAHLRPGGHFIFDCWYGPAVLSERPAVRVKRCAGDNLEVIRIAEPATRPNDNLVDVHYQMLAHDKTDGTHDEISEVHRMRYLFYPEIDFLASRVGLEIVNASEFMTGRGLGDDTWNACFVLRKSG